MKSVQSFQPTVEALSGAVGDVQRTVTNAVEKLNAHESVMQDMAGAATNIRLAAESFGGMNETLTLSATRNEEASKAQLSAARSNDRVSDQFGRIGERLPEVRETLENAAKVIASITGPITSLEDVLGKFKAEAGENTDKVNREAAGRDEVMVRKTGELADKVAAAAAQFAKVEGLASKLESASQNLNTAADRLGQFGSTVQTASESQNAASQASRDAAASGERTAKALEPLPGAITALTSGLESAGASVRSGAETARDSYRELIVLQKEWFAGAELGLNGMKDRLQSLLKAYGDQVEGQTSNLMRQWTEEVTKCLQSYETQVEVLHGGLDELQSAINKLRK
jgi:chromosome segregation ATPase